MKFNLSLNLKVCAPNQCMHGAKKKGILRLKFSASAKRNDKGSLFHNKVPKLADLEQCLTPVLLPLCHCSALRFISFSSQFLLEPEVPHIKAPIFVSGSQFNPHEQ